MPLYEYECTACHKRTEKIQKFSDPEITACPHCGGELKRVLSAPGFAFKGGGWYADGYGSAKPAPAEGSADKSSEKPSDKTSEKPSDKGADKSSDKPAPSSPASESAPSTPAPASAPAPAAPATGSK